MTLADLAQRDTDSLIFNANDFADTIDIEYAKHTDDEYGTSTVSWTVLINDWVCILEPLRSTVAEHVGRDEAINHWRLIGSPTQAASGNPITTLVRYFQGHTSQKEVRAYRLVDTVPYYYEIVGARHDFVNNCVVCDLIERDLTWFN